MSYIGSDVGITTLNGGQIQIMGKAQFADSCCCLGPRTYFHVLENSIEFNSAPYPLRCMHGCCETPDMIGKVYFDRGPWNSYRCLRCIGCVQGGPSFYGHNPKYVCCCVDCPGWYNDCQACSCPCLCGDRLHYVPYTSACCGLCPAKATSCSNCFGLCGPKTGEPLFSSTLVRCLLPGSGDQLSTTIEHARASWAARTNKP